MTKNQLFRSIPPRSLCLEVIHAFGLEGFEDSRNFSRQDLVKVNCVEKLNNLKIKLADYYLPCKSRTYLTDLNTKNVITLLRQLVRLFGFSVSSREKYIKGDKFIIYQLVPSERTDYNPIKINNDFNSNDNNVVTFD